MDFLILLLLFLSFAVLLFIGKFFSESIFHPIRLIVFFWTIMILIPVLFWRQSMEFKGVSYFWIVGFLLAMEAGGILRKGKLAVEKEKRRQYDLTSGFRPDRNWLILKIIILLGFVSVAVSLVTQGVKLSSIFSISGILDTNAMYSDLRREGINEKNTAFTLILSLFVYFSSICGGYCYNYASKDDRKKKLLCIVSVLPAVLLTMMTSGKSGTIAAVMFWVSAWCVSRLEITGDLPKVPLKTLIKIGIGVFIFLLFLYTAMLLRVGSFSADSRAAILNKFYVYAFGQTYNFELWYTREARIFGNGFGYNTYMAIPHFMGLASRSGGLYELTEGSIGNVFTAFRAVIEDFGIIGGLVFGFIKGFITQSVYERIRKAPVTKGFVSKAVLFAEYFWGLYSFIVSPWIYTSYMLMPIGLFFFLWLYHINIQTRFRLHAGK